MKYEQEDFFDAPIDAVVKICLDRSRDVNVYPNITNTKVLKSERRGNKLFLKVETLANGDIPEKLRKLLSPKMLTWIEDGEFDFDLVEYKYRVKTIYFPNLTDIRGHFKYREKDGKTSRHLDGEIKINIPIFGSIAEKKIVEVQKANLKLDVASIRKELLEGKK